MGEQETSGTKMVDTVRTSDDARGAARKRLERKRKFWGDLAAYVVINAFLVIVWAQTDDGGSFWPGWVMSGWGVLLALDAWNAFFRSAVSEADVDAELRRMDSTGRRNP